MVPQHPSRPVTLEIAGVHHGGVVVTTDGCRSKSSQSFPYARACEVKKDPHFQRQDSPSGMNKMDWQRGRLEPWQDDLEHFIRDGLGTLIMQHSGDADTLHRGPHRSLGR